ncbi:DciA family protein [Streptomyces sp. NPDC001312]|uniref:DciA family protein n=1 Tax=Streptomyces sp. NPDC001312 TaxID=3364561 RepID=UPI00368F68DD
MAGHVAAIGYEADTGRLTVCPESSAWAAKTRLEQTRIIAAANKLVGRMEVRALRILAPGSMPALTDVATVAAAAPSGPVKTLETAVDPAIAEAVERQTAAMRKRSRRAFPEPAPDGGLASIEASRAEQRRQADASHAAAPGACPCRADPRW